MAKKKAGKPAKGKGKGKSYGGFVLTVTNLKFVGAAIDEALKDLTVIRQNARRKSDVDKTIAALQELRDQASEICPQSWWIPFETE